VIAMKLRNVLHKIRGDLTEAWVQLEVVLLDDDAWRACWL
jgi:hypothetical protein